MGTTPTPKESQPAATPQVPLVSPEDAARILATDRGALIAAQTARRLKAEEAKSAEAAKPRTWADTFTSVTHAMGLTTPAPLSISSATDPSAVTSPEPAFLGKSQVVEFDPSLARRLEAEVTAAAASNVPVPHSPPPSVLYATRDGVLVPHPTADRADDDFDSDDDLGVDDQPTPQLGHHAEQQARAEEAARREALQRKVAERLEERRAQAPRRPTQEEQRAQAERTAAARLRVKAARLAGEALAGQQQQAALLLLQDQQRAAEAETARLAAEAENARLAAAAAYQAKLDAARAYMAKCAM